MEWKSFILRDRGFDFSPALGIISYTCIPSDMKEEMRFFLRVGFLLRLYVEEVEENLPTKHLSRKGF